MYSQPTPNDTTFRSYSTSQVEEYARRRGGYPQRLIEEVINLHAASNGAFGSLLDLGCGPGNATRDLAPYFDHAIGMDPSPEMVRTASMLGGNAKEEPIRFLVSDAEECAGVPDHSVDLITAATSAHWFDIDRFWHTAARILKPGGTVACFTIWRIYVHPGSTPHVKEIQEILMELEQGTLAPYAKPGNWNVMSLYNNFTMPWLISPPCTAFPGSGFRRQVWNEHGLASADGSYVSGKRESTLDEAEKAIATISAVTRWREAHPDLAHTPDDCVKAAFTQIKKILEAGPADKITMVGPTVLVTWKKT